MGSAAGNDKIVLISGVNGYIATHIGLQLLQKGYAVRGTSRSSAARDHLLSEAFAGFESRYQHYVVPDITVDGAFDDAAVGVHAILHTASPVDFSLTTLDAFMIPAVHGVTSMLQSTRKAGPQLQSFVLLSSIAAISDRWRQPVDHAYTEADWNESAERVARESFSAPVAYGASKTAAERAMWNWGKANQPKFALTAVNPGVVTGPPISWPTEPEGLNETLKPVWKIFSGEAKEVPGGIGAMTYIDVRDVASLHVWCMEHPQQSAGERYLATNGKGTPQAICDILREAYPGRDIVKGVRGSDYRQRDFWYPEGETSAVATKAYQVMGVQRFRKFDESVLDTVKAFEMKWPELIRNKG